MGHQTIGYDLMHTVCASKDHRVSFDQNIILLKIDKALILYNFMEFHNE
jgi:hypothetical protein